MSAHLIGPLKSAGVKSRFNEVILFVNLILEGIDITFKSISLPFSCNLFNELKPVFNVLYSLENCIYISFFKHV